MGFFEYISAHPIAGAAVAALILLTVFVWYKAIASGKKRSAERDRIIADIEKEKKLRNEFRILDETTFSQDKDNRRLIDGMCANVQMQLEKARNMNEAFSELSEIKRNVYCFGYIFEDSQNGLSEFFRSNGEPLLSASKNAVDKVIGGDFAEVFGREFIMLDENDETTSVDDVLLEKYNEEFEKLMNENKEEIYKTVADYIRSNKNEFLG